MAMHRRHWQYFNFHIGKQKKTTSRTESSGKMKFEQNTGSFFSYWRPGILQQLLFKINLKWGQGRTQAPSPKSYLQQIYKAMNRKSYSPKSQLAVKWNKQKRQLC